MKQDTVFAFPFALRPVAAVTLIAVVAWAFGLPAWIGSARAANVDNFTDTISDSDLGVSAVHTLEFEINEALYPNDTLTVTFDPIDDLFTEVDSITFADTDVTGDTALNYISDAAVCTATANEIQFSAAVGNTITFTMCDGVDDIIATSTVITMVIGDIAGNMIVNPAVSDSYVIRLGGTGGVSGDTMVFIIDDVTVTATVLTTFQFRIVGVPDAVSVGEEATPTAAASTATTIPFGVLAVGTPSVMAQDLQVDTNAINGFEVTVQADQTLTAGNLATIDTFANGTNLSAPVDWDANPLGNDILNDLTWGHWGLTTTDADLTSSRTYSPSATNQYYVGDFVIDPVTVFSHTGPVSQTEGQGGEGESYARVGYKAEIGFLQEAANDYTATLTYIATPIF